MNDWYKTLKKAPWTPPNYVFGIIWPILYLLMFISAYLIFIDKKCYPFCYALIIFFIQLAINLSWTTIFFKYKLIHFLNLKLLLVYFCSLGFHMIECYCIHKLHVLDIEFYF